MKKKKARRTAYRQRKRKRMDISSFYTDKTQQRSGSSSKSERERTIDEVQCMKRNATRIR
jgi:hypothetical protein